MGRSRKHSRPGARGLLTRSLFTITLVALVAVFVPGAGGDEVTLLDGRRLEGKVLSRDKKELVLETNLGRLTFDLAEVREVSYGPTRTELFDERWKAADSAADFLELGRWAAEVKLRSAAKRAMRRVIELDRENATAHAFLGHVLYRGEWLSEKERERRAAADIKAERLKLGLVPYGDSWVTPEDRARLEAGQVQVNGQWMEYAAAQRLRGLEEYLGAWLPREEALARRDSFELARAAGAQVENSLTEQALVVGEFPAAFLAEVGAGLGRGQAWFEEHFNPQRVEPPAGASNQAGGGAATEGAGEAGAGSPSGTGAGTGTGTGTGEGAARKRASTEPPATETDAAPDAAQAAESASSYPLNGRLARVVLLGRDVEIFGRVVEHCAPLGRYLPQGWADSARRTHGFYWWSPTPLSVARQGERGDIDIAGHAYHQWGHLLANLAGDDGRLLPPWYDEGLAGLMEFRCHEQNRVFCRGRAPTRPASGTSAARSGAGYDRADLRGGRWRQALVGLLNKNAVGRFDKLAALEFGELTEIDTAAAMGLLAWIESRGPGALAAFHGVLRRGAPPAPGRVDPDGHARGILYDEAFGVAAGMVRQEADLAWRAWILKQ